MKPVCLTLGLLLLAACCCDAMPKGLQVFNTQTVNCCSEMSSGRIPLKFITNITKTSSACAQPAFIVHTLKRKMICYNQTSQWVLDIYNTLQ
ncbi:C-C motif chemokine 4-like [Genypterus blacodes]|uniref:C-C motif chemokine 4-like n=1 Tax=Genypterus blacodes TaxID=154954 RepID=UPI003F7628CA